MRSSPPTSPIGRLEWWLLLAAILVQQGAFIPVPSALLGLDAPTDALGNPLDPAESNPLNFAANLATLLVIGLLSLARLGAVMPVIRRNPLIVGTTILVIASVVWSYDPGLTLRRAGTYGTGVLLAVYLVARLDTASIVRLVALSTVVPAFASLAYAILFPVLAHMQEAGVEGALRGVYAHKNQLANVLAIGFMLQLYLLCTTPRRARHLLLAGLHVLLVLMAHSKASALTLILIGASLALYRLAALNRQVAALAVLAGAAMVSLFAFAAIDDPDGFFSLLGRDATLTGRTDLWPRLPAIIAEHPVLGWGYAAFWQATNPAVQQLWSQIGWQPPHAHNGFFEVAIDFGAVGIVVSLVLIARFTLIAARRFHEGLEAWIYLATIAYTLFNNMVEITLLRGLEFAWLTFLLFYMTAGSPRQAAAARPDARAPAPPDILTRAKPVTALPTAARAPGTGR